MISFTESQKKIIDLFSASSLSKKFYLTGGTALSVFYLQHRLSIDLDFFSDKPFLYDEIAPFIERLKKDFNLKEIPTVKIFDRWQFTVKDKETVKLEFVYFDHEKKRLKPLKKEGRILIDSLEDIAANKTLAYFDRNEPKDLFDLYYLITKKDFPVSKLLELVKDKFGIVFSEISFWSESTKSLKLLASLRPFIAEKNFDSLIKEINSFFYEEGKKSLAEKLD